MQIGRFWGVDPASQFPSGYTGMGNDPANMTDPTGRIAGIHVSSGMGNNSTGFDFGSQSGGGVSDATNTGYTIDGQAATMSEVFTQVQVNDQYNSSTGSGQAAEQNSSPNSGNSNGGGTTVSAGSESSYTGNYPNAQIPGVTSDNPTNENTTQLPADNDGSGGGSGGGGDNPDAIKQFIAIVAGESSANPAEAAAIGSVMINRMKIAGTSLADPGFVDDIGSKSSFKAIGKPTYNQVMNMSQQQIDDPNNPYRSRIDGARLSLQGRSTGADYSNGAYFWNASNPKVGFNWNKYNNGAFYITISVGESTFFAKTDSSRPWP